MKLTESGAKASASVLLFWTILFLSGSSGMRLQKNDKIRLYNSQDTEDGQYPFIVFHIRRLGKVYYSCTGGLIDEQWILTAGHCLRRGSSPRDNIFVGGRANLKKYIQQRFHNLTVDQDVDEKKLGVQERRAAAFFIHPLQNAAGSHDIGLVKLDRPFVLDEYVDTIPLTNEPFNHAMNCSAVGYGLTEKSVRRYHLQHIEGIVAKPNRMCRFQKFRDVICLGDRSHGICHGDSGGPLICKGAVRGVASHGVSTSPKCGQGVVEQYYADVFSNLNWIKTKMSENRGRESRDRRSIYRIHY